jgi:hypothetical protein
VTRSPAGTLDSMIEASGIGREGSTGPASLRRFASIWTLRRRGDGRVKHTAAGKLFARQITLVLQPSNQENCHGRAWRCYPRAAISHQIRSARLRCRVGARIGPGQIIRSYWKVAGKNGDGPVRLAARRLGHPACPAPAR